MEKSNRTREAEQLRMEKGKLMLEKIMATAKLTVKKIGRLSFWGVVLLDLLLRLFIKRPFGAFAALVVGCVWLYFNLGLVRQFLVKLLGGLSTAINNDEKTSLWFEHGGREQIRVLIAELSKQGINYCNLVDQIKDLPPESHWKAIREGLSTMGVISQASHGAFYVTWPLPQTNASKSDAA